MQILDKAMFRGVKWTTEAVSLKSGRLSQDFNERAMVSRRRGGDTVHLKLSVDKMQCHLGGRE